MSASSVRLQSKRGENVALFGMIAQLIAAATFLILTLYSPEPAFSLLWIYAAIGAPVWLMSFLHLRMRRLVREESLDLEMAAKQREEKGLSTLFEDKGDARAARNLSQFEHYIAPAASLLVGLLLLLHFITSCIAWSMGLQPPFMRAFLTLSDATPPDSMMYAVTAILFAGGLFLLGMFAAGLAKVKEWRQIRAGAGFALATTGAAIITGLTLLVVGMFGFIPVRIAATLIEIWMALQGIEILSNFILDIYRPRTTGVEVRPAYDSRLSGLFAEPRGVFDTFAHTLDYQFGFKISESWFFLFLRRALAPLILIEAIFFYSLSCFVIVQPGEVAIIERWGAPRGLETVLQNAPNTKDPWASLAKLPEGKPLEEGLHFKYPWPIEKAILIPRGKVSTVTLGFAAVSEEEANAKAKILRDIIATWDVEHISHETHYLMPMPDAMGNTTGDGDQKLDAVFISGTFTIEYRIGSDADVFRYQYHFKDVPKMLRVIADRQITSYLAGADFWDMMARKPDKVRRDLSQGIRTAVKDNRIGIEITNVGVANIHPPAGRVGAEFLNVIASQQDRMIQIHKGETNRIETLGMTPSAVAQEINEAEAYRARRVLRAKAEAFWFTQQQVADKAAPEVYREHIRLKALESATANARKILIPKDTTLLFDASEAQKPESIVKTLGRKVAEQGSN